MLIVLDTNVLVSALLKRDSKPYQILIAVLEGDVQLAVDERIFKEYTEVLHRPRFGFPREKANSILQFIAIASYGPKASGLNF